jgi:uncharacterized protein (DUF1499 family)
MGYCDTILLAGMVLTTACSPERAEVDRLGPKTLSPCPDTPNCVSTRAENAAKAMVPLTFSMTSRDAQRKLRQVIESLPRTRIVREEPGYLHAEFRSRIFGFVDDVEFVIDDETRRIDFRSASRVGSYDFRANRRRMEDICRRLVELEGFSR